METHAHQTKFNETPPGSPKSCMKGSRRLNSEEGSGTAVVGKGPSTPSNPSITRHHQDRRTGKKPQGSHQSDVSPDSPTKKRAGRTVMIKSPENDSSTTTGTSTSTSTQCVTEIPFQFHLSQHYDNPPPPPNCTSDGSYEEERLKKLKEQSLASESEPTSSSNTDVYQSENKSESLYGSQSEKLDQYDPELVAIASKFVNEIIEKAKMEVANKHQNEKADSKRDSTASGSNENHRNRDFFWTWEESMVPASSWRCF